MRKLVVIGLVAGLMVGSLAAPADARKKKKKSQRTEREASGTYATPAAGTSLTGGAAGCSGSNAFGCVSLPSGTEEHYVVVEVVDAAGQNVAGSVTQDVDDDGMADSSAPFCGKTPQPVAISAGSDVSVFVYTGPCADGSPGLATNGTVNFVFSNRP